MTNFNRSLAIPFLCLAVMGGLSACQKQSQTSYDSLPQVDMILTHEIPVDRTVKDLAFIPNDVAHWLGRVVLLDENGHLFSTDIEGATPQPIGKGTYQDIIGLQRDKTTGVLIALNNEGKIEAYEESDNQGHFKPLTIRGHVPALTRLCHSATPATDRIEAQTEKNGLITLLIKPEKDRIKVLKQTLQTNADCPKLRKINYLHPKKTLLFLAENGDTQTGKTRIIIKDGLVLPGIKNIRAVVPTTSNFGRTYSDGVIAIIDNDKKRIGFIALDYANKQMAKAHPTLPKVDQ